MQDMIKTRRFITGFILAIGLLTGCKDARTDQMLSHIDTLMNQYPDSALQKLDSLKSEKPQWAKSQRMRYDLLYLKAENKAFVPLTSDSIAKNLVSYYDSWGNANERMMAYYLQGCIYRDKGDCPRAIEAYKKAIAQADTTAKDCDYVTLNRIYAQMAGVFHEQLLLSYEVEAQQKASKYAFMSKDTINAILALDKSSIPYILLNKQDSAEIILKNVKNLYMKYGQTQKALQSSISLIHMYVKEDGKLSEAKHLMDEYEAKSGLFDRNHELSGNRRQYYYYKGLYFDQINCLDSAEFYYRKVARPNMSYVEQDPLFRGLLSVYTKKKQADSIAKYAHLFCEVNDSSIAKKDQELTAQMVATYNYSLYQKEALENESKAHKAQLLVIAIIIIVFIIGTIMYSRWRKQQRIQKEEQLLRQREIEELKERYTTTVDEYNNNLLTLQLLDKAHQETIALIQQELDKAKNSTDVFKQKLSEINTQYEDNRQELVKENEALRERIEALKRQEGIRRQLTISSNFADTEIMKRVNTLVSHPLVSMTEKELEQLVMTASVYYPTLLHDLNNSPNISQQEIRACILISQALRESDIAHMLNISAQRITNIKASLNNVLFGQSSARSLYKNIVKKYEIYVL